MLLSSPQLKCLHKYVFGSDVRAGLCYDQLDFLTDAGMAEDFLFSIYYLCVFVDIARISRQAELVWTDLSLPTV